MIVSRCPLRISLIGGGSDVSEFYKLNGGKVVGFAIDKYVYIAMHNYFAGGIKLAYSKSELVINPNEVKHPLIRESMKLLNFNSNVEIGSFADVPSSGTGLGSSSAFTNALVLLISNYQGKYLSQDEVAKLSTIVEIEKCNSPIGKQDQWLTSLGGIKLINFLPNEEVIFEDIKMHEDLKQNFNKVFKLFYLGNGRETNSILSNQKVNLKNKDKIKLIQTMVEFVPLMKNAIENYNLNLIGELLNENWKIKQSINNLSTNFQINEVYAKAISSGAIGGKVLGAGGGGFMLLCVPFESEDRFLHKFDLLKELKFKVSDSGVEIIYNDEKKTTP